MDETAFAEAEPLLLTGYEGLRRCARERTLPPENEKRLEEAASRLHQLYLQWGKPAEAARWGAPVASP